MTDRITRKHLEPVVERINRIKGTPLVPYCADSEGKHHACIGNYHLSGAYGGWCLHQMVNEGGGVRDVFHVGHVPARELYNLLHAYVRGLEDSKDAV